MLDRSFRFLSGWKRLSCLLFRSAHYANICSHSHVSEYCSKSINYLVLSSTKTEVSKCSWQCCHQRFGTSSIVCLVKKITDENKPDLKEKPKQASESSVQVFDSKDLFIGKMTKLQAENLAQKNNLKLVLLRGDMVKTIPSFKLMTGKELYEEEIQQRKERKIEKDQQEKRFIMKSSITDHDLVIKLKHVREILESGCIVKFQLNNINKTIDEEQAAEMQNALFKKISRELTDIAEVKQARKTEKEFTFVLRLRKKPDEL